MRITPAVLLAATALAAPALAATPIAPVSALVRQVTIPHTSFRLANGLTVIVHEDHKAPVVAVSTWYNVGSKDEPPGKTGFAHLYEHLMFNGSENLPGDFFKYLQQIGGDRPQRDDLVRPHELLRNRPRRRAGARAVHGKRPHGAFCSAR